MNGLKFGQVVFLLSTLLAFGNVNAALFGDSDAQKRIDALTQRLSQLETVISEQSLTAQQNTSRSLVDLSGSIDQMRDDVSQLRGQIEVLRYEINELQKRQRDLYTDLDSRLRALEPKSTAMPSLGSPIRSVEETPVVSAAPVNSSSDASGAEDKAYSDAMAFFKRGDYQNAAKAFGSFVSLYPNSAHASSAQYWVGNARFAQRDYRGAIEAQTRLLQNYPDSVKSPDAMLNMASAQMELGEKDAARATLQSLISRYPNSDAAGKARQRIR
jgi:tol-pal system protein YbgF